MTKHDTSRFILFGLACTAVATTFFCPALPCQERERERDVDMRKVMNGLEAGIHALRLLGREEDAARLLAIAREVGSRREGDRRERGDEERAEARRQLKVLSYAKAVYLETGKKDLAELTERAMHAREVRLANRRDDESRQILAREPDRGAQAEILAYAAKLLDERRRGGERAHALRELAEAIAKSRQRRDRDDRDRNDRDRDDRERGERDRDDRERDERDREGDEGPRRERRTEREVVRHRIEVLQMASGVLGEAGRAKGQRSLGHAARALELALENRRGDEAMQVRRSAPASGVQAEWLGAAAEILAEKGHEDRSDAARRLSRELARRSRRTEGEDDERESREGGERAQTLARLHERLEEIQRQLHQIRRQMDELRRRDIR